VKYFHKTSSLSFLGISWGDKSKQTPATVEPLNVIDTPPVPEMGYIPEPPLTIDEEIIFNMLGEPTLKSLGLASNYTPVGWFQSIFEFLHVYLDLTWLQAILVFSVVLRFLMLYPTILNQRHAVKMKLFSSKFTQLSQNVKIAEESKNYPRSLNLFFLFCLN
jgi:membrane protein insertase Oxa1/YidC/SpoIIIJ